MPDGVADEALVAVLADAQRIGMLGDRPVAEVVEHARAFVRALDGVTGSVVDLGSGGGVPGLVIAVDRPDLHVVLVERRTKRADQLERAIRRLAVSDRVEVWPIDVSAVQATHPERFDAATARGFGPPPVTLGAAVRLVRPGGLVVISEPPDGQRWPPELLARFGVSMRHEPGVAVFQRRDQV